MNTSATIYLPESATLLDVADVLGISSGLTMSEHLHRGEVVYVDGLRFSSFIDLSPTIAFIDLHGALVDGQTWRRFVYNFETGGNRGYYRSVSISSTPLDLALGVRVIGIFGGALLCRDDEKGRTIVVEPSASNLNLEDIKRKLLPLTDDEIDAMAEDAAYPRETRPPASPEQIQQDFDMHEEARIGMLTTRRTLNLGNIERERERRRREGLS
jgi:hypothetical protein